MSTVTFRKSILLVLLGLYGVSASCALTNKSNESEIIGLPINNVLSQIGTSAVLNAAVRVDKQQIQEKALAFNLSKDYVAVNFNNAKTCGSLGCIYVVANHSGEILYSFVVSQSARFFTYSSNCYKVVASEDFLLCKSTQTEKWKMRKP